MKNQEKDKCYTCEGHGFLLCGSCGKYNVAEEMVLVRREDLEKVCSFWPGWETAAADYYPETRRLKAALKGE